MAEYAHAVGHASVGSGSKSGRERRVGWMSYQVMWWTSIALMSLAQFGDLA
jgi:adenylosuccinate synthase